MAVNLLFFHVICSQMYYRAGDANPAAAGPSLYSIVLTITVINLMVSRKTVHY